MESRAKVDKGYWTVAAAFAVSIVVTLFLSFAPTITSVSESATVSVTQGGAEEQEPKATSQVSHQTLAESQGWAAVGIVAVPLLVLTGLPLLVPWRRPAIVLRGLSSLLLFAGVLLGALSFGIFYLPPAALMLIATIMAAQKPIAGTPG